MKTRIISAIIMALIGIPILIVGKMPFIIFASMLALMSFKELLDLKKSHNEYPIVIVLISLIGLLLLVLSNIKGYTLTSGSIYKKMLFLLGIILLLSIFYKKDSYDTKDAFYLLGITFFIGICFNLLILLRLESIYEVIYVFTIAILTDAFAYFGGMLFGKHKLCELSPKKTWEGSIVGLVFGTTGGVLVQTYLLDGFSFKILLITLILSIVGQMGDLFFSKIKRENGIKDFSNVIPGHGGILDRMDSVLFIILAYAAIMLI